MLVRGRMKDNFRPILLKYRAEPIGKTNIGNHRMNLRRHPRSTLTAAGQVAQLAIEFGTRLKDRIFAMSQHDQLTRPQAQNLAA